MKLQLTCLASVAIVSIAGSPAVGESQRRGDATITYHELSAKERYDRTPLPVGGIAAFVSHLYYPPDLRYPSHKVQGSAYVVVRVDKGGRVTSVSFTPRIHPELEEIVTEAVHACRWNSGKRRGRPIDGAVRIPVTFSVTKKK